MQPTPSNKLQKPENDTQRCELPRIQKINPRSSPGSSIRLKIDDHNRGRGVIEKGKEERGAEARGARVPVCEGTGAGTT